MSVVLFFNSVVFNKYSEKDLHTRVLLLLAVCGGRVLVIFFTNLFLLLYYFLWALREYNDSWNVARIKDDFFFLSVSQGPFEL